MAAGKQATSRLNRFFPWLLIIGGTLGLIAAFVLTMDKIAILENPAYEPSCNVNPVIACGSVIVTPQASAFQFPNPFLGLAGFAVLITVGVSLLAGSQIKKQWYWQTFLAATFLGVAFIHWLIFQSIYRIGALCPYCMLVWLVTIPIFWYSLLWTTRQGLVAVPERLKGALAFANQNHLGIVLAWFLIIVGLILNQFWYFFGW